MQPEDLFADHPDARAVFEKVRSVLDGLGPLAVRTSKGQVVGWLREAADRAS